MPAVSSIGLSFESHFGTSFGGQLFFRHWAPEKGAPHKGTLVVAHGLGEHSDCYAHLGHYLSQQGWQVVAWDMRGHGRSPGQRGNIKSFAVYGEDFKDFWSVVTTQYEPPFVLFAHSMGALVGVRAHLDYDLKLRALALSAPPFKILTHVPGLLKKAASLCRAYAPFVSFASRYGYEALSRDPAQQRAYELDVLRHSRISPEVYFGMQEWAKGLFARASELSCPVLVQVGSADPVVCPKKVRAFFKAMGSEVKSFHSYKNCVHEVFHDLQKEQAMGDLANFLTSVVKA